MFVMGDRMLVLSYQCTVVCQPVVLFPCLTVLGICGFMYCIVVTVVLDIC